MQIALQILSVTLAIIAVLQKQKWKMMMFYTCSNTTNIFMYSIIGRYATTIMSAIATIRTIIFGIYAFKKIKPNIVWLCVFETAFVVSTILTWQDAFDLLPLVALLSVGFGSWQDNDTILRLSYIIYGFAYSAYKLIVMLYISFGFEAVKLVATIICFVYYCILKKQTPILQLIFKKKKIAQSTNNMVISNNEISDIDTEIVEESKINDKN